jgi:hypothetical protein
MAACMLPAPLPLKLKPTHGTKLTAAQVSQIRRDGQPWLRSPRRRGTIVLVRKIAWRFSVHVSTVRALLKGELRPLPVAQVRPQVVQSLVAAPDRRLTLAATAGSRARGLQPDGRCVEPGCVWPAFPSRRRCRFHLDDLVRQSSTLPSQLGSAAVPHAHA